MTDTDRIFLRSKWDTVALPPSVAAELHPGGPDGSWLSISLNDPADGRSWLHFRKPALYLQAAFGADGTRPAALRWEIVDDGDGAREFMLDFVARFEQAHSPSRDCASPPCSMPELTE